MSQFKVAFYRSPSKTFLMILVRGDLATKIGPLELISFINDETKAEVKLRRGISGNKPGPAPNRSDWLAYRFISKDFDEIPVLPIGEATVNANGDELTLRVEKTPTNLEPLEKLLAQ